MIAPTWNLTHHPEVAIHRTGFAVTLAASIAAILIFLTLRRGRWRPWIGFASSSFDVSMVSLALVTFLIVGSPMVALNSKVTFEMYFLAVTGARRCDDDPKGAAHLRRQSIAGRQARRPGAMHRG